MVNVEEHIGNIEETIEKLAKVETTDEIIACLKSSVSSLNELKDILEEFQNSQGLIDNLQEQVYNLRKKNEELEETLNGDVVDEDCIKEEEFYSNQVYLKTVKSIEANIQSIVATLNIQDSILEDVNLNSKNVTKSIHKLSDSIDTTNTIVEGYADSMVKLDKEVKVNKKEYNKASKELEQVKDDNSKEIEVVKGMAKELKEQLGKEEIKLNEIEDEVGKIKSFINKIKGIFK